MIRVEPTVTASPQQRAVMAHALDAPALVDAGAGTGKTFTIVERVAQLAAEGLPASAILVLTFTKKAAAEIRGRIIRRLAPRADALECATFHAFALAMLKEHAFELAISPDFTLINEIDARVEFYKIFDEFMRGKAAAESGFALRYGVVDELIRSLYDIRQLLRDRAISIDRFCDAARGAADQFAATPFRVLYEQQQRGRKTIANITENDFERELAEERTRIEATAELFRRFDERLRDREVLTYADLLELGRSAVSGNPEVGRALRRRYRHCIVDEFQDTDPRQIRLLQAIFGDQLETVMVVGDPRQSIYGFRGILPTNFDQFRQLRGCVPYGLTENRRSRQEILDLAHDVIASQRGDSDPLRAVRGAADTPIVHVASKWNRPGEPWPKAGRTRELEAAWVASTINALLASGRRVERSDGSGISDQISPRHIAILSRRKTQLQPLIKALNACDLPFRQYGGAGFYDAPEVLDALAWFRLVASPLDDNAVARVLSSPGIGASDATIALLCRAMKRDDGLAERALARELPAELDAEARARLARLRDTVHVLESFAAAPLVEAWEATLDRAGLVLTADLRSGHRHDQARANLEKLSAMVRGFAERNPSAQAIDFVRYVRELDIADADDQEADPPAADALSIMTIHAAKGLEWPIVFLIDVWPNPPSAPPRAWLCEADGALLVTEGTTGTKPFHTLCVDRQADGAGIVPQEKVKDPEHEREEQRLFYVGLTRARDELYVSGGRRAPSKSNSEGRIHPYLGAVIGWLDRRGWNTVDELAPAAPRRDPSGDRQSRTLPLGDYVRERALKLAVATPPLSFSTIAEFERCPRSVNYDLVYRLPALGRAPTKEDNVAVDLYGRPDIAVDLYGRPPRPPQSLLSLGAYGDLVHRALELWARAPGRDAAAFVSDAVRDTGATPSADEHKRAVRTVETVIAEFAGAQPLLAEAPFTFDIGDVIVTGFIDLALRDANGKTLLIDYKTGTKPAASYALQLALYRKAAADAYGLSVDACVIARVSEDGVTLEDVELPGDAEIEQRVARVARGIASADLTARPGAHCDTCPYRAAPCMDYAR